MLSAYFLDSVLIHKKLRTTLCGDEEGHKKSWVTHVAFGVEFDEKLLSFEAQFANSSPWESIHFGNTLKDEQTGMGYGQIKRRSVRTLKTSKRMPSDSCLWVGKTWHSRFVSEMLLSFSKITMLTDKNLSLMRPAQSLYDPLEHRMERGPDSFNLLQRVDTM